jgi:hypothetical protein
MLPLAACSDTDGGLTSEEIGVTFGGSGRAIDNCRGNNLNEYTCAKSLVEKDIFILLPTNNMIQYYDYRSSYKLILFRNINTGDTYEISVDDNGQFEFVIGGVSYFFPPDYVILLTEIDCPSGICKAGACIAQRACTETDGARRPDIAGTTTNQYGSFSDACARSGDRVNEYYCYDVIQHHDSFLLGSSNSEYEYMAYSSSSKAVTFQKRTTGETIMVSVNPNSGKFEFVVDGISYFFLVEDPSVTSPPIYPFSELIKVEVMDCASDICQAGACTV